MRDERAQFLGQQEIKVLLLLNPSYFPFDPFGGQLSRHRKRGVGEVFMDESVFGVDLANNIQDYLGRMRCHSGEVLGFGPGWKTYASSCAISYHRRRVAEETSIPERSNPFWVFETIKKVTVMLSMAE
jgi:hypothetical protein